MPAYTENKEKEFDIPPQGSSTFPMCIWDISFKKENLIGNFVELIVCTKKVIFRTRDKLWNIIKKLIE